MLAVLDKNKDHHLVGFKNVTQSDGLPLISGRKNSLEIKQHILHKNIMG
jgi:hypothetical protein